MTDLDTAMHDVFEPLELSETTGPVEMVCSASPFLNLPREIRDTMLGEVFFPGEKESTEFEQDYLGLAKSAVRQIFPCDTNKIRKPRFDVSVIRTCRQLQKEAEAILYGTSSWNLMYQDWDWGDRVKWSYEVFERFPKRIRKLIRRIERKCYSEPYDMSISLYDWQLFMTFLARECPNLHSLKLWGPGDRIEGRAWVETCTRENQWVQAILQITNLREFDIPVIKGGVIYDYPEFRDDFLPWLKASLTQRAKQGLEPVPITLESHEHDSAFQFLDLPRKVRDMIYRYVLLPPGRRIHPYVKSWLDGDTQNALPLFLTCEQVREESELILYSEGVFTAPTGKYEMKLVKMVRAHKLTAWSKGLEYWESRFDKRQAGMIRHLRINLQVFSMHPLISFAGRLMRLKSIELVLGDGVANRMNRQWRKYAPNKIAKWRGGFQDYQLQDIAKIPLVRVETSTRVVLNQDCLEWFTEGLRRESLFRIDHSPDLDWLYVTHRTEDWWHLDKPSVWFNNRRDHHFYPDENVGGREEASSSDGDSD